MTTPFLQEWNDHSIPAGMECHSTPNLKKYATRTLSKQIERNACSVLNGYYFGKIEILVLTSIARFLNKFDRTYGGEYQTCFT